jgi:hypothetical protein
MPSITDVFNELVAANARLDQIHTDLGNEIAATNTVKTGVDQVDATLQAGFTNVAQGMQVLANLQHETNQVLLQLTKQDEAIICILEHISQNTCELVSQSALQTRLQTRIRDDADAVRDIVETTNPAGALERARRLALQGEIERCCPPEPAPAACTYEPCPHPEPIGDKQPDSKVPPFKPPKPPPIN